MLKIFHTHAHSACADEQHLIFYWCVKILWQSQNYCNNNKFIKLWQYSTTIVTVKHTVSIYIPSYFTSSCAPCCICACLCCPHSWCIDFAESVLKNMTLADGVKQVGVDFKH